MMYWYGMDFNNERNTVVLNLKHFYIGPRRADRESRFT
jgi:hypothetical protein